MSTSGQIMDMQRFDTVFTKVLPDVLSSQTAFFEAFGGQVEKLDGISMSDQAFVLKHCPQIVTLNPKYKTDENLVFEENSETPYNRFGKMKEIKYTNIPVKYTWTKTAHEGIDKFTVNADLERAVAERAVMISEAVQEAISTDFGEALGKAADSNELTTTKTGEQGYTDLFDQAYIQMEELGVRNTRRAYITPEVYTKLVNSGLTTTAKGATTINIENQELVAYKGFILQVVPTYLMPDDTKVIFSPDNVGIGFVGIETFRVIESHDFDGKALQFASKGGSYILDENKRAIFKVKTLPADLEAVLSV